MARHQGKYRLQRGVTRPLTLHELDRGYVYISRDKALIDILNVDDFTVEVDGASFYNKRLDVSGRVHIPKQALKDISDGVVNIKVVSRNLMVIACL